MSELLTAAQMRAIEEAAIASGEVTGLELMERAGKGVVEAIFEEWPEFAEAPQRAVVLCGPGNNGGDGFVVARLLRGQGWEVEVFLYGDPERLPPDAKANYERWCELGEVKPLPNGFWIPVAKIVVDALFGIGLKRTISKEISYSLSQQWKAKRAYRVVSVDLPSGLCSDSGKLLSVAGKADLTVTFYKPKNGHFLAEGPAATGKVVAVDIGLPVPKFGSIEELIQEVKSRKKSTPSRSEEIGRAIEEYEERKRSIVRVVSLTGKPAEKNSTHKYSHGHALILSGPIGRSGAARLAARGALRVGAGVVTVAAPGSAMMECANQLTAIMLRKCEDADALASQLEDARINALCIGPGLGHERARALVPVAVETGRAAVLDADALSAFGDDPDRLFSMLHPKCVLTPHQGEFARLFPDIAEKLAAPPTKGPAYSKVDATRDAATRAGCTVLFKGPDTVIANENGLAAINSSAYDRAAPWLATAGSGDVLAGFITGLLARGFFPMQAAETGAWLHTECALKFGPGLIAEDIPEALPAVFRDLEING